MNSSTRNEVELTSTISGLSDNALLAQTKKLAHLEQQLQVTVIDHLREIHTRRLYLSRGFSSLFDYVVRELGYTDSAAARRINTMHLCAEFEEVREGLQDGSFTLSTVRPLGTGRYEMKVVIDAECHRGLERLRGLLSHVDPHMTLGQLVGRLAREGLDRHDPGRPPRRQRAGSRPVSGDQTSAAKSQRNPGGGAGSAPRRPVQPARSVTSPPKRSASNSRAIPMAIKRRVCQRDDGRCSYVDPRTGRRCASRHLLQIDHQIPYALGGSAEPGNLRLLCFAHHRHRHRGTPLRESLPSENRMPLRLHPPGARPTGLQSGRRQADSAPNASIVDLRRSQAVPRSSSYWRIDIITPTALPFPVTHAGARCAAFGKCPKRFLASPAAISLTALRFAGRP